MGNPADDRAGYPFSAFDFSVEIRVPGMPDELCSAAFAECDGLEMTMDVKTIKEGGNNATLVRLPGMLGFGTLTLKRGPDGLASTCGTGSRRSCATRRSGPTARWSCSPPTARPSGPAGCSAAACPRSSRRRALNARDGMVAIEELQLAYETMVLKPGGTSRG